MTPTRHRLTHRPIVALAVGTAALMALSACGSASSESGESGSASSGGLSSGNSAYDAIVNGGPQADSAAVEANTWAAAVKKAGTLRVGGTETSTLFSNLDPTTGVVTGFDAGITQLLARYILGDASRTTLTQVSVDTREELLVNGQVDLVAATYSITPARLERIDFAGPYYSSQAGIMVKADNTDITGVGDLAGKTVATQAGSTGETVIAKYAPEATVLALPDAAAQQRRQGPHEPQGRGRALRGRGPLRHRGPQGIRRRRVHQHLPEDDRGRRYVAEAVADHDPGTDQGHLRTHAAGYRRGHRLSREDPPWSCGTTVMPSSRASVSRSS